MIKTCFMVDNWTKNHYILFFVRIYVVVLMSERAGHLTKNFLTRSGCVSTCLIHAFYNNYHIYVKVVLHRAHVVSVILHYSQMEGDDS